MECKRVMYVLQNKDGKFFWKSERVSSMHGSNEEFTNAHLFRTRRGAESVKRIPAYSECEIKEVEIKLI